MLTMKVGFIFPDNNKVFMNYDEVNDYCKKICEMQEYYEAFKAFEAEYTYFDAYFDFVMKELGYVFINPFLRENTYLKFFKDKYFYTCGYGKDYICSYEQIVEWVMQMKNYIPDIVLCSNKKLNIESINGKVLRDWMIDPNGYAMISEVIGNSNHDVTSDTILNQLLISKKELWKKLDLSFGSDQLLIEHFGFLRSVYYDQSWGYIVGVKKFMSNSMLNVMDIYTNNSHFTFLDYDEKYNCSFEKLESYPIKQKRKEQNHG